MIKSNKADGRLNQKIALVLFVPTTFTILGQFNIFLLKFDESVIWCQKFVIYVII
jgi:hypothetical protein